MSISSTCILFLVLSCGQCLFSILHVFDINKVHLVYVCVFSKHILYVFFLKNKFCFIYRFLDLKKMFSVRV